jgi:hypothetical protein
VNTVYRFKPWARLSGDPQQVGEEIERIRQDAGGTVSSRAVVEAARPDDAPLHRYFEWQDGDAAEKYREIQAAHLLRSIVVVETPGVEVTAPVRAFVSIREAKADVEEDVGGEAGSYTAIADAIRVVKYREQMMKDALRDLDAYRMKYQLLSDLTGWGKALETARSWLSKALEESQKEAA